MTDNSNKWDQLLVTGGGLLAGQELAEEDWSGQTLGAFELVGLIDEGGMSSVYRGRRIDQFEQQVAVKVMGAALQGKTHLQRFLRERQILANLDHPGIARIIDGGVVGERPYLVMEFVSGQAIDEYCDLHQPDFTAKLRLLSKVAAAVEHAHDQGVIHQDLKPANVLVNELAEPKLLDFGISGMAGTEPATEHLMTPLYAAPEQFSGGDINTATDVFQMGLLVGRIVTGQHPLVHGSKTRLDEVREQIVYPKLLSDLAATLPGPQKADFLYLLQRCLQAAPNQRYASMAELGQDLDALSVAKPLPSRSADTGYRLKTAARRRRTELTVAVAIVMAAVLIGTAVWRQIEHQQAQVVASGENAAALGEVVTDILESMDPLENGSNAPLNDVISTANFEKLATATRNSPQVQREMVMESGRALVDGGRFAEVITLVEPLLAELDQVEPKPPRFAEYQSLLGYARYRNGDLLTGLAELRGALALQNSAAEVSPLSLAQTLQRLAMAERRAANIKTADQHITRALQTLPDGPSYARQRAQAQSQQGLILTDLGDLDGALAAFRKSLQSLEQLPGETTIRRAMTLSNMADTLRLKGELTKAQENARSSVGLLSEASENQQLLATASTTLGNVYMAQENYLEASRHYGVALEAYRSELGDSHPRVALVAHNLGTALRLQGDCQAALVYYEMAVSIAASHYPPDHPELLESQRQRSLCSQ